MCSENIQIDKILLSYFVNNFNSIYREGLPK